MADNNNMYEKLSFTASYPDDEVKSAIANDNLKPKQWSRSTIADGKIMQRDTMSQFFYRDMALASAIDNIESFTTANAGSGIIIDDETKKISVNVEDTENISLGFSNNNELSANLKDTIFVQNVNVENTISGQNASILDVISTNITSENINVSAISSDSIETHSISSFSGSYTNLDVDNLTAKVITVEEISAYPVSALNIINVSAIEGNTDPAIENTYISGFNSIITNDEEGKETFKVDFNGTTWITSGDDLIDLSAKLNELDYRKVNSWKQWSEDHGSSGDDESVWIGKNSSAYDGGFAEGTETIASGFAAHAEGEGNSAFGVGVHAEGVNSIASGLASHAEGGSTIASGYYSHAEGFGTSALGYISHVEGSNTIASGNFAHAEGDITSAIGFASHAENGANIASGSWSHAEGNSTSALGHWSHTEGACTVAEGNYGHAEGQWTSAFGFNSHAEGGNTKATNNYSHAEGCDTSAFGNTTHAEGCATLANDFCSHAEGNGTSALGSMSHAEGGNTIANQIFAHAEGNNTSAMGMASHTEGMNTLASGMWSHAEGYENSAIGNQNHVGGYKNITSGSYSFAHGNENSALAESTFVVGNNNIVTTNISGSFIAGNENSSYSAEIRPGSSASPVIAINIGGGNQLSGEGVNLGKNNSAEDFGVGVGQNLYTRKGSYAFGQYASAEDGSFVFGGNSVNANSGAFAAGRDGVSADFGSVAVGTRTVSAHRGAVAFGHQGISAVEGSVVLGQNNVTAAQGSMAVGQNGVFADVGSVAIGKDTISAKTNALAIGQSNTTAENEALAIGLEGATATSGSIAFGGRGVSASSGALAIGWQGATAREGAVALGMNTVSAANGAMAVGFNTTMAQYGSFAAGLNGTFATNGSIALGFSVSANQGSVAVGEYVKANEGSVIVGNCIGYNGNSKYIVPSALGKGSVVLGTDFYLSDTSTITSNSYSLDLVGKSNSAIQLMGAMYGFGDQNLFAQRHAGNGFALLMGYNNTANSGGAQIGIGYRNFVNDAAIAIGENNYASSGYTIAIGWQNSAFEGGPWAPSGHGIMLGSRNNNYGSYVKFTPGTDGSEEEEGQYETFNFLVGDSNTAYGHNMFAFGAGNYLGSTDSNITLDRNNDGFAFAYGTQNTAVRNYDMAIGFRSYASGGENVAIGHASALGYRNLVFDNSYVSGIQNIVLTESKLEPNNNISIYDLTHNLLFNAEYNKNCFNLRGWSHNNIFMNGIVNVDAQNICKNIFINNDVDTNNYNYKHGFGSISGNYIVGNMFIGPLTGYDPDWNSFKTNLKGRGVTYNNIINGAMEIIATDNYGEIHQNTVYNDGFIKVTGSHFNYNNAFNGGIISGNFECANNNLIGFASKLIGVSQTTASYNMLLSRSTLSSIEDYNAYIYANSNNFLFGTQASGVNNVFSFSDGGSDGSTYALSRVSYSNRVVNFGDNEIVLCNDSFIRGHENRITGGAGLVLFGYSNTACNHGSEFGTTAKDFFDTFIQGSYNTINSYKNDYQTVQETKIQGSYNTIFADIVANSNNRVNNNTLRGCYNRLEVSSSNENSQSIIVDRNTLFGGYLTANFEGYGYYCDNEIYHTYNKISAVNSNLNRNILKGSNNYLTATNENHSYQYGPTLTANCINLNGQNNYVTLHNNNSASLMVDTTDVNGYGNTVYFNVSDGNNNLTANNFDINGYGNNLNVNFAPNAEDSNWRSSYVDHISIEDYCNSAIITQYSNESHHYANHIEINGSYNKFEVHTPQTEHIKLIGEGNQFYVTTYTAYGLKDIYLYGYQNSFVNYATTGVMSNIIMYGSNNVFKMNPDGTSDHGNHDTHNNFVVGDNNIYTNSDVFNIDTWNRGHNLSASTEGVVDVCRTYILGNDNAIKSRTNDVHILGHDNHFIKDDKYKWISDTFIQGYQNSACNGSDQILMGLWNRASGYVAQSFGLSNIANDYQTVFGMYNESRSDTRERFKYKQTNDSEGNTVLVEQNVNSGVIFEVGNGYFDGYEDEYGNVYKANGNSTTNKDETAIVRSNAMIVSANGTVSAQSDVIANNISLTGLNNQLVQLTELLQLLDRKPVDNKKYLLGCVSGELDWVEVSE